MKGVKNGMLACALIAATFGSAQAVEDDWGGADKAKHFAAGAAVGLVSMAVQDADSPDRFRNAVLAGAAVGLAKELRDDFCNCGTASVKDFVMTVVGAAAGASTGFWIFPGKDGLSAGIVKPF